MPSDDVPYDGPLVLTDAMASVERGGELFCAVPTYDHKLEPTMTTCCLPLTDALAQRACHVDPAVRERFHVQALVALRSNLGAPLIHTAFYGVS